MKGTVKQLGYQVPLADAVTQRYIEVNHQLMRNAVELV